MNVWERQAPVWQQSSWGKSRAGARRSQERRHFWERQAPAWHCGRRKPRRAGALRSQKSSLEKSRAGAPLGTPSTSLATKQLGEEPSRCSAFPRAAAFLGTPSSSLALRAAETPPSRCSAFPKKQLGKEPSRCSTGNAKHQLGNKAAGGRTELVLRVPSGKPTFIGDEMPKNPDSMKLSNAKE